ncbi:hypothetical protein [Jannaschia pohangensis]|nr:hypothetical protein [Jannaschia pohangensis]
MSFLSRIFPRSTGFDPFEGHARGAEAEAMMRAGDWSGLGRLYAEQAPQARAQMVHGLGMVWPLDRDLSVDRDTAEAKAVLGGMQVTLAFRERGDLRGDDVPPEALARMEARLADAERRLVASSNAQPDDPCVWGWLIRANTGLGGDRARFAFLSERLDACSDRCLTADLHRITDLQRKWHGNQAQMWEAVARAIDPLPSAAYLGLVARGHIEDWLWYVAMGDDAAIAARFREKMQDNAYLADLDGLDGLFWRTLKAEGPDSAPEDKADRQFAHNQFAILWALLHRIERAKPHVAAIGPVPMALPLGYLGEDPTEGWIDLRQRCGLPAKA